MKTISYIWSGTLFSYIITYIWFQSYDSGIWSYIWYPAYDTCIWLKHMISWIWYIYMTSHIWATSIWLHVYHFMHTIPYIWSYIWYLKYDTCMLSLYDFRHMIADIWLRTYMIADIWLIYCTYMIAGIWLQTYDFCTHMITYMIPAYDLLRFWYMIPYMSSSNNHTESPWDEKAQKGREM